MGLLKSSDFSRSIHILPSVAHFPSLRCPEVHTPRTKQRKTEENTLLVCAPLVDSETFDFLFQLALSPIVDMYAGKNVNGVDSWKAVNVSVGNFNKTRAVLQDFVATIILPETRVQSL